MIFIPANSVKMKALYIFVGWFLISTVICDSEKIMKAKRSIGEDEFTRNSEEDELDDFGPTCSEVGEVLSTESNQKIQFEIIMPESIRYMEVIKVDVVIYNRMNSRKPLDVELTIPDEGDNYNLKFFNSKCSSSLRYASEFTKIITVPQGLTQSFSFYIQASKQSPDPSNFVLKVSNKNENYECYLTKKVKIEPAKIKTYETGTKMYELRPNGYYGNGISTTYREDRILRFFVEIIANQSTQANFSVALSNEEDFNEIVNVTDLNADTPIYFMFPENSTTLKASIEGSGLCTIKITIEETISINNPRSNLHLNITTLSSPNENEGIVRVCATYDSNDFFNEDALKDLVYDVEMPGGYVYDEVIDIEQKPEIKVKSFFKFFLHFSHFFKKNVFFIFI